MQTESTTSPTLIQSLQRGMLLIEAVTEHGPLTARALSDATGIALPTAYHLLRTLVHEDYLRRTADGDYALGRQVTSVTQLGCRARSLRLVHEAMTDLAAEARASVIIGVLRDGDIKVSQLHIHPSPPRFECWAGMTLPGHATAIGKNILFQMGSQRRADYLATHELDAPTAQTVTTTWRLEGEIEEAFLAYSDQQYLYGISCTATTLHVGHGLAALGTTFASARTLRIRDRTDDLVVATAARISDALTLDSTQPGGDYRGSSNERKVLT